MTSSFDPWCGLDFAVPKRARRAPESLTAPRTAIQKALAAEDPVALAAAIAAQPPRALRSSNVSRHLADRFSPACADVLHAAGLLPGRVAFDLARDRVDAAHVAWWLSDPARVQQLFNETATLRYQRTYPGQTNDWLSQLLRSWSDHHPVEFVQVAQTAAWPEVQRTVGGSSRFPFHLLSRALESELVNPDEVRSALERAITPPMVRSLTVGSSSTQSTSMCQGIAMEQAREALRKCSMEHAAKIKAVIDGSELLTQAWVSSWTEPSPYANLKVTLNYPSAFSTSRLFEVRARNLLEDQLLHAAPATISRIMVDDVEKPSPLTLACIECFKNNPDVLSAFVSKLGDRAAPAMMARLAPHLIDVRVHKGVSTQDGLSFVSLCLSRHPTLAMFNALARQPEAIAQLIEPGPSGRPALEELDKKIRLSASQRESAEKSLSRGRKRHLEGIVEEHEPEERPQAPRRTM